MQGSNTPLRLHLGCGTPTPAGWVDVDRAPDARLAKLGPLAGWSRTLGLSRRLPWRDGSVAAVYCAHTLDHLGRREGEFFLFECARVLAPGGVARVVVTDLSALLADYEKGAFPSAEFVERLGVLPDRPGDGWLARRLAPLLRSPRRCLYDAEGLLDAMYSVGLEARIHAPGLSRLEDIGSLERGDEEGLLIVEGVKGDV
ncbi:MAG: class I SAM-dependent methyltransferase [Myxococcota bacterium]